MPATLIVVFAPRATAPLILDVPVVVVNVPPFKVKASAPIVTFCKSRVAPLASAVPAAVVPKPAALVTTKVPAVTEVVPV